MLKKTCNIPKPQFKNVILNDLCIKPVWFAETSDVINALICCKAILNFEKVLIYILFQRLHIDIKSCRQFQSLNLIIIRYRGLKKNSIDKPYSSLFTKCDVSYDADDSRCAYKQKSSRCQKSNRCQISNRYQKSNC